VNEQIYRKLAERLDAFPIGFPATGSGVELQLLARIFTPEEAALASVMDSTSEPCDDIAARAGVDPEVARHTLEAMARKGLIGKREGEGRVTFGRAPPHLQLLHLRLHVPAGCGRVRPPHRHRSLGFSIGRGLRVVHRVRRLHGAMPVWGALRAG
jgi:hypothetical protein